MATMSTSTSTIPTTASHCGTVLSSERRSIRKNSTMTTARSTMAMSSWVMPEVMCPNPLNRLNGWVRWNTTAMPPTTSTAAEQMSAGSCTAPPRFCSARMHWVPKIPAAQARKLVKITSGI